MRSSTNWYHFVLLWQKTWFLWAILVSNWLKLLESSFSFNRSVQHTVLMWFFFTIANLCSALDIHWKDLSSTQDWCVCKFANLVIALDLKRKDLSGAHYIQCRAKQLLYNKIHINKIKTTKQNKNLTRLPI